nr:MAG TPA: hypothetical protein [Bacteriophage sp.]
MLRYYCKLSLYNICKYKSVYSVKNIINWVIAFSYTP